MKAGYLYAYKTLVRPQEEKRARDSVSERIILVYYAAECMVHLMRDRGSC